ncbi:hypothetical protein WMF30_24345 [Sorangium sp. So ce134]
MRSSVLLGANSRAGQRRATPSSTRHAGYKRARHASPGKRRAFLPNGRQARSPSPRNIQETFPKHRALGNQQPATSNQQPATSNQQPATSNSNQQPATSNRQPITGNPRRCRRRRAARLRAQAREQRSQKGAGDANPSHMGADLPLYYEKMGALRSMLAPDFAPFLGDPRILGEGNLVKGTLIGSRAHALRQSYGERFVADLGRQLSPQAARYLSDPPIPSTWNDMAPLIEVDCALMHGLFAGRMEKMRHFGADVARNDLTTIYKTMALGSSPSMLFKRFGLVYKTYFKYGDFNVRVVSDVAGKVTLAGGGLPLYLCSQGISGWIEAGLALAGSRRITVDHTTCRHRGAPRCTWSISWG